MMPINLPDMSLDLSQFDMVVKDHDYVEKQAGKSRALENWSGRLGQYAVAVQAYLDVAANIPIEIRRVLSGISDRAVAAEERIRRDVASIKLPVLEEGNELMLMRVKADKSAYEVVHPSQLFTGWMNSLSVTVNGVEKPVISTANFNLPEFGEYDLNSNDDYERFIVRLGVATQASSDAQVSERLCSEFKTSALGSSISANSSYRKIKGVEKEVDGIKTALLEVYWRTKDVERDIKQLIENALSEFALELKKITAIKDQAALAASKSARHAQSCLTQANSAEQSKQTALQHSQDAHSQAERATRQATRADATAKTVQAHYDNNNWIAFTALMSQTANLFQTQQIIIEGGYS